MTGVTSAQSLVVRPAARLRGELTLPGDKSISHRALMLATLAAGESRIDGRGRRRGRPLDGGDLRRAGRGRPADRRRRDGERLVLSIASPGVDGLREPAADLDCGNSGTSLRLFAGILAGLPFRSVLDGDDSLRRRPVARIIEPLRSMGAALHARSNDSLPPVTVIGRSPLQAVDVSTTVPSAQVKSAILLAALRADGRTTVRESVATRDHTERMLRARGVSVETVADGPRRWRSDQSRRRVDGAGGRANGSRVTSRRRRSGSSRARSTRTPSSPSAASASTRPVGRSSTSSASMGADIERGRRAARRPGRRRRRADRRHHGPLERAPCRSTWARATSPPRSTRSRSCAWPPPSPTARPRSAAPASCATRSPTGSPASRPASLRSARGSTSTATTCAIHGRPPPCAARPTDSLDDHRLAMTFAIAGLVAAGETVVGRPGSAAISYPGFFDDLERVRS